MLSAEEFIDLNLEDVGNSVELVYTPVREDGVKGSSKTILSDVIDPADPVGLELVIPDCCEEKELVPQKRYFGGVEGSGEYAWYRTQTKLEGAALMNLCNDHDNVLQREKRMTFTPSLEDVGAYMALRWEPMRADGKCGKPLVTISVSPVKPALLVVSKCSHKGVIFEYLLWRRKYFGGHEGSSRFSWYRETTEKNVLIDGADSRTYEVTDSDYNCRLLFGFSCRRTTIVKTLRDYSSRATTNRTSRSDREGCRGTSTCSGRSDSGE